MRDDYKKGGKSKRDPRLKRAGVSGFNKPKRTPNHPKKSHVVVAKEGDKVKIGQALFFDKTKTDVKWASPANGLIKEVQYGPRRVLEKIEIEIKGHEAERHEALTMDQIRSLDRGAVLKHILESRIHSIVYRIEATKAGGKIIGWLRQKIN